MQEAVTGDQEISLRDIFDALKRQRKLIIYIVCGTLFLGVLYAVFTTPRYTATVTVMPVSDQNGGGALAGLAAQFGSVASLAGINLNAGGSDTAEYVAVLKSRGLGEAFIKKENLKRYLFPDQWDTQKGKWRGGNGGGLLAGLKHAVSAALAYLSGDEGWGRNKGGGEPSLWDAYEKFDNDIRVVREDEETGLVTVSFTFPNPSLTAEWANAYISMVNQEIRLDTVREATRALDYLENKAKTTAVAGLRDTIYKLVENQLERITLANARDEFAFKVIDKAVVPEQRSQPRRGLIVVLSVALGGIIGIFVALVFEAYQGGFAQTQVERPMETEADNRAQE